MKTVTPCSALDARKRVDLFGRDDWIDLLEAKKTRPGRVADARRDLPIFSVEYPPSALWGFDIKRGALRLFAGQAAGNVVADKDVYKDRRNRIRSLMQLGALLYKYREVQPPLRQIYELQKNAPEVGGNSLCEFMARQLDECEIQWSQFSDFLLVGLFKLRIIEKTASTRRQGYVEKAGRAETERTTNKASSLLLASLPISRTLEKVYDYYLLNRKSSGVLRPLDLFSVSDTKIEELIKVQLGSIGFSRVMQTERIFFFGLGSPPS